MSLLHFVGVLVKVPLWNSYLNNNLFQGQNELIPKQDTSAIGLCFMRLKICLLFNYFEAIWELIFITKEVKVGLERMTFWTCVLRLTTRAKKVTLDLFVGQRRDRNEGELLDQPLVQPVEVFVAARHLDVVKLEQDDHRQHLSKSQLVKQGLSTAEPARNPIQSCK